MSRHLMMLTEMSPASHFDEAELRECLRRCGVTKFHERLVEGELFSCEYRTHDDVVQFSAIDDLTFVSTDARDAGYELMFRLGHCLSTPTIVVCGDNEDSATEVRSCATVAEFRHELNTRGREPRL